MTPLRNSSLDESASSRPRRDEASARIGEVAWILSQALDHARGFVRSTGMTLSGHRVRLIRGACGEEPESDEEEAPRNPLHQRQVRCKHRPEGAVPGPPCAPYPTDALDCLVDWARQVLDQFLVDVEAQAGVFFSNPPVWKQRHAAG